MSTGDIHLVIAVPNVTINLAVVLLMSNVSYLCRLLFDSFAECFAH